MPVPHLCPNSLTSGRKWDSTYQMRDPLQFFNLCFESCLILDQMKRLDVIFLLTECIVIYNHNNTPEISLRIVYYFSASYPTYPTYPTYPKICILQMTTKNFVQMPFSTFLPFANFVQPFLPLLNSIQLFFTPPELCSTFFRPLNFVQLTQLLTLALLSRLYICLSCNAVSFH